VLRGARCWQHTACAAAILYTAATEKPAVRDVFCAPADAGPLPSLSRPAAHTLQVQRRRGRQPARRARGAPGRQPAALQPARACAREVVCARACQAWLCLSGWCGAGAVPVLGRPAHPTTTHTRFDTRTHTRTCTHTHTRTPCSRSLCAGAHPCGAGPAAPHGGGAVGGHLLPRGAGRHGLLAARW
jgi:hypothetical protein